MSWKALVLGASCAAALAGCRGMSDGDAVRLVEEYNRRLIAAFRAADPTIVAAVAGPRERKKLAGLIGVKVDQGITLDAQLLSFHAVQVAHDGHAVVVSTEERWYYLDRRIGTGERVGQDSTDEYKMRYRLVRNEGRWTVDSVEFAERPVVGRKQVPDAGEARVMHGLDSRGAAPEAAAAGAPH